MTTTKTKRSWLKYLLVFFIVLFIGMVGGCFIFSESMPSGTSGKAADELAEKMFVAINKKGWDNTGAVQWTFAGRSSYIWDKERHWVEYKSKDKRVLLNINEKTGVAYEDEKLVTSPKKTAKLVNKAWKNWVNDSFWLNAPAKAFDPGTERTLVELEDGKTGLMVSYTSGGVTPGDSYLWILDENGLPTAWKMWVKIIPVGGVEFSWEDWTSLTTGAKIATNHKGMINIPITDLKAAATLQELVPGKDLFEELTN